MTREQIFSQYLEGHLNLRDVFMLGADLPPDELAWLVSEVIKCDTEKAAMAAEVDLGQDSATEGTELLEEAAAHFEQLGDCADVVDADFLASAALAFAGAVIAERFPEAASRLADMAVEKARGPEAKPTAN